MSEEKMPKVIQIICTAVADCFAQNNHMAANELLDAAGITRRLLKAAQAALNCIGELPPTQARIEAAQMLQAAIEKATGVEE